MLNRPTPKFRTLSLFNDHTQALHFYNKKKTEFKEGVKKLKYKNRTYSKKDIFFYKQSSKNKEKINTF